MNRDPLVQLPPALVVPPAVAEARAPAGGNNPARYILGVDGGATKTLAAVLDLDRRTLHLGHGGPSNQDAVGSHSAVAALLHAADEALSRAGIAQQQLATAVLAVAGTDTNAIVTHIRAARTEDWIVVNDVVGAWATATGARPGVGVISGTGSNVFGVGGAGADTRAWRAGGWGHLLGDEGSGYWLGAQSLRAALQDRDGSGPPTALSETALQFFSAPTVEALAARVYTKPLTKGEIAAFAIETARLADDGDAVARALYARAAAELGGQTRAVIAHTGLAELASSFPVGLIGSAFKAGPIFVEPLTAAIHASAPHADVFTVELAPVGGSLLLAARACGREGAIDVPSLTQLIAAASS